MAEKSRKSDVAIEIIKQETGRFDRRFGIGPAVWPCFDLLWIHSGAVRMWFDPGRTVLELQAPGGILIFPGTAFEGRALGDGVDASVTHFTGGPFDAAPPGDGYLVCARGRDTLAFQAMVNLSMDQTRRGDVADVRQRLLAAILDGFRPISHGRARHGRLDKLWREAEAKLEHMRGLADVAALAGLSESALRALHRKEYVSSAGRHLQTLRLDAAERMLATTGMSVREIAKAVGYAHPESFSAAFKRTRNRTPLAYRRLCQRLA